MQYVLIFIITPEKAYILTKVPVIIKMVCGIKVNYQTFK